MTILFLDWFTRIVIELVVAVALIDYAASVALFTVKAWKRDVKVGAGAALWTVVALVALIFHLYFWPRT